MNDVSNKASGLPVRKGGNRFPSLSQLVQQQKECLLLDVSGSMAEWVEGGRKIDRLRSAIQPFGLQVRKFIFSAQCHEVQTFLEPQLNTALDRAFTTIKAVGISHTILVTDGLPDSEEGAINASVGLKIDVIFVGRPDDEKAIAFLRRLCKQSGGQYGATVLSLEGQELLTQQIAGLLEGGQ